MSKVKWVRLGDYIIQRREKNDSNELPIYGVTRDGFIPPKQKEADTSKYNVFYLNDFVFNPARMEINSIYLNDFCPKAICSSLYEIFYIKDTSVLLPHFLHLFLKRAEFARHCEYIGWGSAREYCRVEDISDIEIPLPSLSEQQKVVNAWKAFREIKEQNEAKAAPLMQLCQSYIQELKHKYPAQEIGPYIEEVDERNSDLSIKLSQGIANTKVFQDPKQVAANSKADKIVRTGYFGYNRATTRNGEKISIAYRTGPDCTVSSAYGVFKITDEEHLNPYFLWMWVSRPEFDRYARYMSKGSAHEFFEMDEMRRVRIPLPPLDVQRAIVNIYKCANEAKQIAAEADRLSREVCPALIQHVIHN